ncbi:MAG TPA: hypothetical protein VIL20_19000 [Sandaracinaceae bacterium]
MKLRLLLLAAALAVAAGLAGCGGGYYLDSYPTYGYYGYGDYDYAYRNPYRYREPYAYRYPTPYYGRPYYGRPYYGQPYGYRGPVYARPPARAYVIP